MGPTARCRVLISLGRGNYQSLPCDSTEAAAATAFVGHPSSDPIDAPVPLVVDSPFVFSSRDIPTQATLCVGQFVAPE